MGKRIECVGKVFGHLTVVGEAEPRRLASGRPMRWMLCRCDCGNLKEVVLQNLSSGCTSSCGCRMGKYKHGHSAAQSPTYHTWSGMRARCHDPKHNAYSRYGAAGVQVCDRWRNAETGFQNFLEDMGERPAGRTLDRIKGHLGYYKDNCRWATNQEQYENKRVNRDASGKFKISKE